MHGLNKPLNSYFPTPAEMAGPPMQLLVNRGLESKKMCNELGGTPWAVRNVGVSTNWVVQKASVLGGLS